MLNVGEEKSKGTEAVREAHKLLSASRYNFIGNVEGGDILKSKADVVVCDGFVGNIVLKFGESVPSFLKSRLKNFSTRGLINKLAVGLWQLWPLKASLQDMDPNEEGGVPVLGVNGVTIIGHGSSTAKGIKNMILRAVEVAQKSSKSTNRNGFGRERVITKGAMEIRRATITAVGHYVPEKILTNADLEKMVDTNDEWIRTRTGIRERRILEQGATSDLAVKAIQQVLTNRGIAAEEIELIIVATITPDMMLPATAYVVQEKIGASKAWGFDLNAACSGFLYALSVGARFIETGVHSKVIVVGADKMSSITDYTDRNTCVLFGDAAGAVLLEPTR